MTALTAPRLATSQRDGVEFVRDVAADTVIFAGALVVLDASGNAAPGSTATGLIADGRAEETADNTDGLAAAITVKVRRGVYRFENSASTEAITKAQIGDDCYIVDDQTVAKTNGDSGSGATRSKAGRIEDVDSVGVWVRIG
ncbi:MAG: hypothetical protein ACOY45_01780 [Pseudomonadota bacterium]